MSKKRKKKVDQTEIVWLILSFFIIIIPLLAIFLYGFGVRVQIPKIVMGAYCALVYIAAGVLMIVFTVLEKFGFGKAGLRFNRFYGLKQLTKKEAKANDGVFGGVMIAIGICFAVVAFIYC